MKFLAENSSPFYNRTNVTHLIKYYSSPPLASAAPGDFLGTVYRVPPPLQARKNCGTPLLYILPHVVDNRQGAGGRAICKHEQMS